ncbi:hypothetical protein V6N13_003150 [Hibiscus sabdariffa]
MASATSSSQELIVEAVQMARTMVVQSRNLAKASMSLYGLHHDHTLNYHGMGLTDCLKLYDESESRLSLLLSSQVYTVHDARTWLSGVLANHRTCLEGMADKGFVIQGHAHAQNLTNLISEVLALYAMHGKDAVVEQELMPKSMFNEGGKLLTSWNPATSKADFVVSRDGSGTHKTINEAVAAVARMGNGRRQRVIIYVKAGVYNEKVDINKNLNNIMLVGDGMDRTTVTGNRNVPDGSTTYGSATFGVSGDGFWARDITFENTAGPHKHQAVALRVSSDHSVFYRCSFKGYQDTLFVHSLRQFYRDCHIYGTIDFIFGDASAVLQNCDIFVKRPMDHQSNMLTAQGREDPNENTGISIVESRVRPASDFESVKHLFKSYLGRPWKKYSRTVFMKTDLDGLIHPKGWDEWSGNFALSTLYYAEYMNTGIGASTGNRVTWPGFHVFNSAKEASPFTVSRFIQGELWIPETGVPFRDREVVNLRSDDWRLECGGVATSLVVSGVPRCMGLKLPGEVAAFWYIILDFALAIAKGIANAVGLALAEKHLAARFNKPGDGCQMEGVANEACSLAGHWGLGKLIAFYDDNHISIDGDTEIAFTKNVDERLKGLGWHVIWVKNGNTGYDEIRAAIKEAKAVEDKPTLIKVTTTIGYGSPNKSNSYIVCMVVHWVPRKWMLLGKTLHGRELFDKQSDASKESVLPSAVSARVSIEAGTTFGWEKIVGSRGKAIGIDGFGASAPAGRLYNEFGLTTESVVAAANELC